MVFYKVLNSEGHSCNGGDLQWSLPKQNDDGTWTPGDWHKVEGELIPCERGLHVTDADNLPKWLHDRIFRAEVDGECVEANEKYVCRKVRLVSEETNWNERTKRLFGCDCAERVLPIHEAQYPDDSRVRDCIDTARRFARGEATKEELYAAADAADAAYAAADAAAHAAADAAYAAAYAAHAYAAHAYAAHAHAAADAAYAAADAAHADAAHAYAAHAYAAHAYAAVHAAHAAVHAAHAERKWQAERLQQYLSGEVC